MLEWEQEGTLDYSFIKDRPRCALDDVLKMTKVTRCAVERCCGHAL